jgi:ATP-dependent RNA helicase DeaD
MDTFDDLGLSPELTEALAAEGVERPTAIQAAAVPVLRRGNHLLMAAGPGSGTLFAWAAPLLDRLEPEGSGTRVLILTTTADAAAAQAESLGGLAGATGHSLAAVGSRWHLPGMADVLIGTPKDVLAAVQGDVSLDGVQALVVDQASVLETLDTLADVERVLDYLPKEAQRIVTSLPVTPAVEDFMERHVRRAAMVPPRPSDSSQVASSPQRGSLRFRITTSGTEADLLDVVALLLEDARHVLVFCRSEDRAADMGDLLTLHGYMAGAPGDGDMPVWLGVDELAARAAAKDHEGVVVVSCDVPADQDSLDRRHGISDDGVVLVLPREVAHLRSVARETGYTVKPLPPQSRAAEGSLDRLRATLEDAMRDEDIAPYLLALEPLFSQHDPAEVAAAAVALLRKKVPSAPPVTVPATDASPSVPDATAWAKIFLSVGERDNLRPGDLLGAITGEAGIKGEQVGRIDIHESHTVVEVNHSAARQVIKALNGTTIRGRSVRADFDRPKRPSSGRGRRP